MSNIFGNFFPILGEGITSCIFLSLSLPTEGEGPSPFFQCIDKAECTNQTRLKGPCIHEFCFAQLSHCKHKLSFVTKENEECKYFAYNPKARESNQPYLFKFHVTRNDFQKSLSPQRYAINITVTTHNSTFKFFFKLNHFFTTIEHVHTVLHANFTLLCRR